MLKVEQGRTVDLYALLLFQEDLAYYNGYNFQGGLLLKDSYQLDLKKE